MKECILGISSIFGRFLKKFFFIIIYDSWPGNPSKSLLLKSTILGLKALEIYLKKSKIFWHLKNIFQKFSLKCFILIPDFC